MKTEEMKVGVTELDFGFCSFKLVISAKDVYLTTPAERMSVILQSLWPSRNGGPSSLFYLLCVQGYFFHGHNLAFLNCVHEALVPRVR
jgi:hypothetical protein